MRVKAKSINAGKKVGMKRVMIGVTDWVLCDLALEVASFRPLVPCPSLQGRQCPRACYLLPRLLCMKTAPCLFEDNIVLFCFSCRALLRSGRATLIHVTCQPGRLQILTPSACSWHRDQLLEQLQSQDPQGRLCVHVNASRGSEAYLNQQTQEIRVRQNRKP